MAIDVTRRVLTRYEADTGNHEKALDRLKSRTTAFSKSLSDLGNDFNDTMDKLGKMNQAWEGASKILEITRDSVKAYGDEIRLVAAAGKINIDELSEAYGGLINQHELLELAAKSQHGALKLSQEQLDTLGKATVALAHQGFDLTETFNKLRDAAVKGKAEGLDDLGISIKEGATAAETLDRLMGELNKKIGDSTGLTSTAADEVQQYTVMWENLKNELMIVNGEYTVMMTKSVEVGESLKKYLPVYDAMGAYLAGFRKGSGRATAANGYGFGDDEAANGNQQLLSIGKIQVTPSKSGSSKQDDSLKRYADQVAKDLTDALVESLSQVPSPTKMYGSLAEVDPGLSDKAFAQMKANLEKLHDQMIEAGTRESRYSAFNDNQNASWMTKTFGTPEEFNAFGKAFGNLEDAVGSAFEALVTGSESGGKAFKNMLASGMLATGKSEVVEAIKAEAWALGSLAGQDYKGFTLYQLSALKHAAAAAAAGVAANSLGAGQSGSPSGASGSSSGGSSSGGQSKSTTTTTTTNYIIIGDNQADDSPRMRQRNARRIVDLAAAKTDAGGAF